MGIRYRKCGVFKQDILNQYFSLLAWIKIDETEIDLLYLSKASSAPLILIGQIFDWVKRHEGSSIQSDTDFL